MTTPNLSRFPHFELSYETVHHKKVCASDSVALACPMGKKHFVWFFERRAYLVDLNKDRKPVHLRLLDSVVVPDTYLLETVVFATCLESGGFLIEDIYVWKGVHLANLCFGDRVAALHDFIKTFYPSGQFALPYMWEMKAGDEIGCVMPAEPAYPTHHIQYREMRRHAPYINVAFPRKGLVVKVEPVDKAPAPVVQIPKFDYAKPQFRQPAVFQVVADVQFDIYHLYAYGSNGLPTYCGLLGMPTYKTSVFMNSIFRKIRENRNLDYIEESDDEDDFENTDETKYVDLEKVANIECVFHSKFKKWVPVRLVGENERIVPIGKLVYDSNTQHPRHMRYPRTNV